jgi:hypothetical protein
VTELSEEGATVLSTIELLDENSVALNSELEVTPMQVPVQKLAVGGGKVIPLKRKG